ncbi:hypothetical protein [Synechocystis sp. LKSZ1]|uniref:hypothetical protein n=1 Tax=Synechocystis sp. LKSZ1 TaxID=3144951 RepID=UPI00336BBE70
MASTHNTEQELQSLVNLVEALAQSYHPDSDRLLALLRTLEQLHRQIRTELFEPSLPNTRHDLYAFLRDVEESGGWPYIERGKLQTLLERYREAWEHHSESEKD